MRITEGARERRVIPRPFPLCRSAGMGREDWCRVVLLWVIVTAANLFKPFHIDDTAHLEIARWIATDPWHPMSGMLNWSGTLEPIFQTNQPHLFFYVLAGWSELFGFSEVSLHLLQSVFAFAAIALFHSIAIRLVLGMAGWLTAMLALGPAFVVEQNVMVDLALLAVWLAFFRLLILGVDSERQHARYVALASFASVALLIKYSSLVLVVALVVSLVLERRRSSWWVLLIPAGTLVAWSVFNVFDYGAVHLFSRTREGAPDGVLATSYLWVLTLGALLPLGLMIVGFALGSRARAALWAGSFVAFAMLALSVLLGAVPATVADWFLLVAFLVNGVVMAGWIGWRLVAFLRPGLARIREPAELARTYLFSWIVLTTVFYVVLGPFVASRHLLLILPPILLLFGQTFASVASRRSLVAGLAVTVVVSLGLGVSDWRFASFYRDSAAEVASSIPDGARVWTSGHWGWQWYAEQQGMVELDLERDEPRPGDYYVVAEDVHHWKPSNLGPTEVVARISGGTDAASLLCTGRPARFYSTSDFGPWSLSRECTGDLTVYRVLAPET